MAKLTQEQIQANKTEFINLLRSTNRQGIDTLINWLENNSDFFTAPSSSRFHGAYEGGLCQHSLNVYHAATQLFSTMLPLASAEHNVNDIKPENIIIVALLHDLCKTNFYVKSIKNFKDEVTNTWRQYYTYDIHDTFPVGHGEKSVIMAQNFIRLTGNEIIAIRWHMGTSDPGAFISPYEKSSLNDSMNSCPLLVIIQQADVFASYMMEGMFDPKVENLIA